ncbi:NAD-dependent epimerase/dehydratase family protein [Aureicoccus marinus]|uniref:NAD-dependent epimerase/dehydratase domain-containing protein n=1 Tax=Aureicoccus marinus TaxID=754435 RepID=A0A2S7T9Z1_9FLAO|nr:NAD-dependent epimerase/dehydratase family protein [Aureicoccus marinus]PQJ16454.1 hypothetical protein BST99_12660 [Aureicoccus marinus]
MVLVTGGTGLLGSHLLFYLSQQTTPLRALFRRPERLQKTKELFRLLGDSEGDQFSKIEWVQSDLLDIPALEEALASIEQVYHCAGMVSFDPADRKALYRNNVRSTSRLIDVCLMKGVKRLLFVSSIAATGKEADGGTVNEESPWNPTESYAYGQSKWEAELEVWRGQQEGLETVVVNPGVILGTGFWGQGSDLLISRIYKGLKIYPPGQATFISVDNTVAAMMALMQSKVQSRRFILFQEQWNFKQLFRHIAKGLNKNPSFVQIPLWSLGILSFLDRLKAFFFKSTRQLPPEVLKSLQVPTTYSNEALKEVVDVEFIPLEEEIMKNTGLYRQYKKRP